MERASPLMYTNQGQERRASPFPVLNVNVLCGWGNDDGTAGGASPLVGISSSQVASSLIHRGFTPTLTNAGSSSVNAAARKTTDGPLAPSAMGVGGSTLLSSSPIGIHGAPSSSLAKPVMDLAQVRCCPTDQWVPDAPVVNCMAPDCGSSFSLFNRKHRCRMCGRIFCSSCCNNLVYVPASALRSAARGSNEGALMSGMGSSGLTTTSFAPATSELSPVTASTVLSTGATGNGGASYDGKRTGTAALSGSPSLRPVSPVAPVSSEAMDDEMRGLPTGVLTSLTASGVASTQAVVPFRVCASCSYEIQLVISTRQDNGEPRRRSRGELKMLQRALILNVLGYLTLPELAKVSLVSADFYFMSRDNLIWYQYNMSRWVKERELPQLSSLSSRTSVALRAQQQQQQQQRGGGNRYSSSTTVGGGSSTSYGGDDMFRSMPVIQDATALSESEAAKRVISLHARYNFTQFLDFARRQEMALCEGLSSFSLGARILLSSPIRVALVGPCGIGKTACAHVFLGERPSQMVVRPTIGLERRTVTVRLARGLSTEVDLDIYDLSGAERYGELRRLVCRHCHVLGLCYDPSRKVTLVQAADIMMGLEDALGPQPVVVCGLVRQLPPPHGVAEKDDAAIPGHPFGVSASSSSTAPSPLSQSARDVAGTASLHLAAPHSSSATAMAYEGTEATAAKPMNSPPESCAVNRMVAATPNGAAATDAVSIGPEGTEGDDGDGSARNVGPAGPVDPVATAAAYTLSASSAAPTPPLSTFTASATVPPKSLKVSAVDAVGITVRGHSSIQCPLLHPTPFFEALVQSLLDRLADATVASTATISDITAELTMQDGASSSMRFSQMSRSPNRQVGRQESDFNSVEASRISSKVRRRRGASRAIVQELLNLTMQPCVLDILLEGK